MPRFWRKTAAASPGERMLLRSARRGNPPSPPADDEMPDAVADSIVVAGSDSSGNEMPDEIPEEKPDAAVRDDEKPDAAARDAAMQRQTGGDAVAHSPPHHRATNAVAV